MKNPALKGGEDVKRDGLDLSFLNTLQNQIENISRRLKDLEQR